LGSGVFRGYWRREFRGVGGGFWGRELGGDRSVDVRQMHVGVVSVGEVGVDFRGEDVGELIDLRWVQLVRFEIQVHRNFVLCFNSLVNGSPLCG